jgi:tight adherence protein C
MDMILIGVMVVLAVGLIVYSLVPKKADERDAVKRRLSGKRGSDDLTTIQQQARESATANLVKKASPMLTRLIMPQSDEEQSNLKAKLVTAGFRQPTAQQTFLMSKTVLAIIGLMVGVGIGFTMGFSTVNLMGSTLFGAGVGFMLPNIWLGGAVARRQEKIGHGLPDTLDLLVVSVESGLGLDAAIKRVGDELADVHPELSEEMRICTVESQMGIPRSEAMQNMARRTDVESLGNLVSVIIQAERFGTSVAKALRNQAETLRTKRHQAAEEKAQKTAVKLLMPLILFIFPALGIVLAGPAAIRAMRVAGSNPNLGG